MKPPSISRRVYRAILVVSVLSTLVMVLTVLLVNEDLERTMIEVEFAQERDFILMNHAGGDAFIWDTPQLAVAFVPAGGAPAPVLPEVFRGMPADQSAELYQDGETYLVSVESVKGGVLYVAKNITHFEKREVLFDIALLIIAVVIIALSLLLAVLSSRRIVKPLKHLSERIGDIPVGPNMPRIEIECRDAELHSIVLTFNRFLDELESYVRREQSLLGLASHELRTPIAVMSGALDIIEQRGRLDERDQNTLRRIRQACEEMRDNVGTLLRLARRESKEPALDLVDVGEEARQVVADVGLIHHAGARLRLQEDSALVLRADRAMVRMLLRNLIQNAVQHTQNDIRVTIGEESIEIEDEGTGLDAGEQARLRGRRQSPTDRSGMSGLGLYIVTLMTERLGWRLGIAHTDAHGTKVLIRPALRDRAPPGI